MMSILAQASNALEMPLSATLIIQSMSKFCNIRKWTADQIVQQAR
jgi:hypothetical protein